MLPPELFSRRLTPPIRLFSLGRVRVIVALPRPLSGLRRTIAAPRACPSFRGRIRVRAIKQPFLQNSSGPKIRNQRDQTFEKSLCSRSAMAFSPTRMQPHVDYSVCLPSSGQYRSPGMPEPAVNAEDLWHGSGVNRRRLLCRLITSVSAILPSKQRLSRFTPGECGSFTQLFFASRPHPRRSGSSGLVALWGCFRETQLHRRMELGTASSASPGRSGPKPNHVGRGQTKTSVRPAGKPN